jgi:hypothetical protein
MQAAVAAARALGSAARSGAVHLGKTVRVHRAALKPTKQVGKSGLKGVRNAAKESAAKHFRSLGRGNGTVIMVAPVGNGAAAGGPAAYTLNTILESPFPTYCSCSVPSARSLIGVSPEERMVRCTACAPKGLAARKAVALLRSTRRRSRSRPPTPVPGAAANGSRKGSGSKRNQAARTTLPKSA